MTFGERRRYLGETSHTSHLEFLTAIVGHYENADSLQDRIVERARRAGLPSTADEVLLDCLRRSLCRARMALECEDGQVGRCDDTHPASSPNASRPD